LKNNMKALQVFTSAVIGMIATSSAATYNYTIKDAFEVGLFVSKKATIGALESEGTVATGEDLNYTGASFSVNLRSGAYTVGNAGLVVGDDISAVAPVVISDPEGPGLPPLPVEPEPAAGVPPLNVSAAIGTAGLAYAGDISSSVGPITVSGVTDPSAVVNVKDVFVDLISLSNRIAALAAANPLTPNITSGGGIFTIPTGVLVYDPGVFNRPFYLYNLSANALTGDTDTTTIKPNFGPDDLIVFNVINDFAGGEGNLAFSLNLDIGGSSNGGPSNPWADNYLWNISNGNLRFEVRSEFIGTLLAPGSAFTSGTQIIEGAFVVQSYTSTGGELRPITGGSLIAAAVPEPTSALAGVLLSLGLVRRKRS
jgi:choice-of-anchor A domain-containing protein